MRTRKNSTQMFPNEWRASTSLSGVYALRMLGMFLVLPVMALYASGLEGAENNKAWVGLAMGIYGLTQALMQLPLGIASDRFGRKRVIYVGLMIFALGSFIAASAHSLEMLVLGRGLQGAGAVSAAVTALLADLTRNEVRTRAMAMIGLSIGLTFSVSLVASPMLTGIVGVSGLFWLTGGLSLLSILVVAFWTPNVAQQTVHEDAQAQPARFGEVLKNRQLMSLNFGIFVLHCSMMILFTVLPFAMQNLDLMPTRHWKIYFPATLIGLIVMIPAIIVGETRNKLKQVFILGIALTLVAVAMLMLSLHSLWAIGASLVVYFIGFNILEACQPSMVSKIAPAKLKGTAMGIYNTLQSIGLFSGGLIGGYVLQHFGFQTAFGLAGLLLTLWLIWAIITPAPKPVRTISFNVGSIWLNRTLALQNQLNTVSGIEEISFSSDGKIVYLKALQKGFDETTAQKIILGASQCH